MEESHESDTSTEEQSEKKEEGKSEKSEKKERGKSKTLNRERDMSIDEIREKFNLSDTMHITFPAKLKSLPKSEMTVHVQTTNEILAAAEISRQFLL